MNIFLNIFLYYTTIIIIFRKSFESNNYSLIFQFTTILKKDPELSNSLNLTLMNNIMENILLNDIYIKLELGSPPQNLYLRISANSDDFFISKSNSVYEEKYSKKNGSFYFDGLDSSTFYYQTDERGHLFFSHTHLSEYVKDNIIFNSTKNGENKICIKNFTFLLAYKVNGPHHGIVGLKGELTEELKRRREDFFTSLKKFNLIKNDIWYLKYDNNKFNGSLILGNYPHNDQNIAKKGKNEIFKINHFRKIYTTIIKNNGESQWGLSFDKIYLKNVSASNKEYEEILDDCEKCKNVELNPNFGAIIGPTKYKLLLESAYLNKFLNNKICFQPILKISKNNEDKSFYYYYCYSSYIEQMRKEFMPIIFEHKEFKYNFTLNFDDLYVKKNNYIFLKIIFQQYQTTNWVFGAPFTNNYLLLFDSNSKEIGFYSENINDNINVEIKKSKNSFVNILQKTIIGFLLVIIGVIIGKKLFGLRRKLRANELEEKFEYKPASEKNLLFK